MRREARQGLQSNTLQAIAPDSSEPVGPHTIASEPASPNHAI